MDLTYFKGIMGDTVCINLFVLYYVNFEVINNGFSQTILHTHGGYTVHAARLHILMQVSVYFPLLFSQLLVDFAINLVLFLPSFR